MKNTILASLIALSIICPTKSSAEHQLNFNYELIGNVGSGDFAPYYMASNIHGILTQPKSFTARVDLHHKWDKSKRFSLGYGATMVATEASSTTYSIYDSNIGAMTTHDVRPADGWIQQLYLDIKYRSLFLTLGAKEVGSNMLNNRLSSGDMTWSANARPIPGFRAGFIEPQNIPFTNGWLKIDGDFGYFKQTDSGWQEDHYNYYNYFITTDTWLNYKRCYFITNPEKNFSGTIGMQAACQFGGLWQKYKNGTIGEVVDMKPDIGTLFRAFIPGRGGASSGDAVNREGNHLGSWDVMGRYKFKDGKILKAYYQSPWEDGSGIGKLNGFDGLYGIEYKSNKPVGIVTGAVVEYLDLMNQGGPIHWAAEHFPNSPMQDAAGGSDDYYNNYAYNGYQNYGMAIGTPMLKSTLYNLDGYLRFTDTRLQGVHLAVEGYPFNRFSYRAMFSYRKAWGTTYIPMSKARENTSAMIECRYYWNKHPYPIFKAQVALDRGSLYGNNFGVLLSVSIRGLLKF